MPWTKFARIFCCLASCIFSGNAAEKTAAEYLRDADVVCDVQKERNGLVVVGKEFGQEVFRTALTSFDSFDGYKNGNFNLQKLGNSLSFQYSKVGSNEVLNLLIEQNGNVEFLQSDNTGWNDKKTYGVKTFGTLTNRANLAFYFLVTSADAFHNYGTVQSYSSQFYNNYLFNSGVIRLGEVPKAAVDLTANLRLDRYARPRYKKLAVDNCGLFMTAKGTLKIKGGISYNEYNVGDFEDLEMFGGDINVQGTMRVGGTLRGNVRDILVTFDAGLYVNNMAVQNVRNFDVAASGAFHTASSMDLEVTEKYRHAGQMSSGGSLGLYVAAGLSSNQSGMLLASDEVSTDVTRTDKPVQKLNSPPLLSDPAIHNYLTTKAPKVSKDTKTANANLNDDKLDKLRDAYYERMKYKEKDPDIWLPALRYSGKNRKFIVYTDYYLNVITYHYHNGRLVNITETGYIWQKRDKSEQEVPMEASPEIQRLIDALNDVAKEPGMAMIISGLKKEKADQAYQKQLTADLEKAGAAPADIATVFDDPLMKALRDLRYMSDTRQDELFAKKPYVQDLSEYMEDARDAMAERLESYLDSPVKRFIDDVVIPVLTIGTILAGDLVAPMTAPATVPALVASAGRLAVPLSRVATAIGVNEIYQQLQKFFNEKFGGGDKGRIQNTPQEARGYLQGLKDMNVLGRGHRSGKYMTHEITKDCTYKGYKFKKGNIISRDTRHHEIEVFQDSKTHLGAIEPRGGTMYKGQDLAKKLHGY